MKKPKLKKYPTGGSKGFIQDKLVHYVGQGETPYTREQLEAMGYNYETTTDGFDEYSMGDNRRFYKTVLPNSPGWNNPENPYLTNTAKPAVAKVGHKTGPYPSYGSPEYIQAHPEYTPPKPRIPTFKHGGMKLPKYYEGDIHMDVPEDPGLAPLRKPNEPVASAADQQQIDNNKPNYGAIAGATTGAVANSMVAYNRPDTNVSMKAEANRNGVAAIAGSINPVVGGIIGGVNAIAKPIKANNERTDSQGNLVNQNGAQASAIVGGLMSPSSAFTAMSDGKWDLTGKKYANSLEADARARIAEEKAPELAAAAAKRNMYYTYAQGGTKGDPTIEKNKKFLEDYYKETFNNSVYRTLPEDVKTMDILTKTIGDYMYKLPGTDEQKYSGKTYDSFLNGIQDIRKKYPARPGYSNGGIHSGTPNAEVEKEEVMRMPNGQTTQVDGPSHDNGGVPVNIPDGTQIFSDRLKDPTTKKTFAKMAEKYKVKDLDPNSTDLKKSTEELNNKIKQDKLDKIFKAQESLKALKMSKYASKLGLDPVNYANGGTKLPQYGGIDPKTGLPITGTFDQYQPAGPIEDSRVEDTRYEDQITAAKDLSNSLIDRPDLLNMSMNTSRESFGYRRPVNSSEDLQSMTPISNKDLEIRNNQNRLPNTLPTVSVPNKASTPTNDPKVRKMNPDWIEPTVNTLVQNAGNIAYLAGEGKKYDKQDFYKYNPELYNPADALRQADIEANVNRNRLKDASGGNAGALMSNLTQSQAINTLLKSKIRTDAANQNAGTLNDAQIRNIQGKYNVDDINARNKGQALTNYYKAISGIGQNTSASYRSYKAGQMDRNTAEQWGKVFKDMGLDMSNPTHWELVSKNFKK